LNVHPIDPRVVTPMARHIKEGFERASPGLAIAPVTCNLLDCIGCGRCNLGCQYGAKQSMLETTIPAFVDMGGVLVPDADVDHIVFDEHPVRPRVNSVIAIDREGDYVEIKADRFVLASGCYASTKLLWRSGYQGAHPSLRTVGARFSGNFGTSVTGRFPELQNGWSGQQVSYVVPVERERLVIELAFAPPAVIGLSTSLWGARLMEVLKASNYLGVAVPVMGTLAYGTIRRDVNPSGFAIDFKMIEEDWRRLSIGMRLCAEAMFEIGAEEGFTTRFDGRSLKSRDQAQAFFAETGPLQYLRVETAHLQGGNVIHEDPLEGVVGPDLKVHGIENLWITDASVIPAPITLNIQLTVMALAAYAARGIVRG
jgi:choline dehydrogenase-like flavoprotein